ncbi:hypothetical protein CRENBAI_008509 [Crenichthys baileyi]|uniref:Uncharacterized protein n=1 Tax=Crenichthys baileyi TaxID=28760 RepID=A0AAV9QTP5_9TELE
MLAICLSLQECSVSDPHQRLQLVPLRSEQTFFVLWLLFPTFSESSSDDSWTFIQEVGKQQRAAQTETSCS